jgi:HEAT repeat protein
MRRLHSPDALKRVHACVLLADMGAQAKEAVPTLLQLLQEDNPHSRKLAAWTLGSIGQGAGEAIPVLMVAVRDSQDEVRKMAREALEKISASRPQAGAA